MEMDSINKS